MTVKAVIAAAGSGRRMGAEENKLFLPLDGRPLLAHTLAAFEAAGVVEGIVVVLREEDVPRGRALTAAAGFRKVEALVPGGAERQDSVGSGLAALGGGVDVVVVHDGARPLVSPALLEATAEAARRAGAALAAVPVKDTIKVVDPGGVVTSTPDRRALWAAQTPQAFRTDLLREAFAWAAANGVRGTDEASLVELYGHPVRVVPGEEENLKITTPLDLRIAAALLARSEAAPAAPAPLGAIGGQRVGFGYDVHPLVPGRRLVLGGVEIPHETGLAGHSDADAVAHAIIDALLGAAGEGDIGRWFPDSDERHRDADSLVLLAAVARELRRAGWRVGNVDVTVVAERPRLAPFVDTMRERLAAALAAPAGRVNVKATTTEGLGFAGRREGIAAYAVALLTAAPPEEDRP